jgi:PAS domain S-box-containing protein
VDPEQVAVARELASILAVAIRQARLRERVEQHAAELESRVAERTADLERSQQRLLAIAQALPDLVFVVDHEGRYLEILAGANELLVRDAAVLKGRRFHDVVPRPVADQFLDVVRRTIAGGQLQVLEYQLAVPAGERWFEGRATPIDLGPGFAPTALFVARDITERKRAEALERENIYLREELSVEGQFGEIVGSSRPMRQVFRNIALVAGTDSTVLLLGETGTGKELIARAIHEMSRRRAGPMIKVNCGALPASLAESELFGHERGAFTGALQQKKGRFELAHHGTIFLDEVGELSLDLQVKLLRVLQEKEIERVGGTQTIRIDARVIAATNRDLAGAVQDGTFRSDLFYRLNIFPIDVPPLRDRKDDLPSLVDYFVRAFTRRIGRSIQGVAPAALERLQGYDWPGNVRELANVLERAVILCEGPIIQERHLGALKPPPPAVDTFPTLEEMERQHILRALQQSGGRRRPPARHEPFDRLVAHAQAGHWR